MAEQLLEVRRLSTGFQTDDGFLRAVDDVSFSIRAGETLGIVGESGCGKSVTSLSLMRLISAPGKIESGEIFFEGKDLLACSDKDLRHIRGNRMAMIFQEPMSSLNPVYTCGEQIQEVVELHQKLPKSQARKKSIELLELVGIPFAQRRVDDYPHQLSGGMRQRVMIAMALTCSPQLLIADEPTTALDVTIQAQILDLLRRTQSELKSSLLLITHDLGVVAEMCQRVLIMYAGRIVEQGHVEDIFYRPKHPYTQGLLSSIPHFETGQRLNRLKAISGVVPNLGAKITGCRFQDRCEFKKDVCKTQDPALRSMSPSQSVACHFPLNQEKPS